MDLFTAHWFMNCPSFINLIANLTFMKTEQLMYFENILSIILN